MKSLSLQTGNSKQKQVIKEHSKLLILQHWSLKAMYLPFNFSSLSIMMQNLKIH